MIEAWKYAANILSGGKKTHFFKGGISALFQKVTAGEREGDTALRPHMCTLHQVCCRGAQRYQLSPKIFGFKMRGLLLCERHLHGAKSQLPYQFITCAWREFCLVTVVQTAQGLIRPIKDANYIPEK